MKRPPMGKYSLRRPLCFLKQMKNDRRRFIDSDKNVLELQMEELLTVVEKEIQERGLNHIAGNW